MRRYEVVVLPTLYLVVLAALFYVTRDLWRVCLWGLVAWAALMALAFRSRARWQDGFAILSLTFPMALLLLDELGFAGTHYARTLGDRAAYPAADEAAHAAARGLIRTNPRRRVGGIPVHHPIQSEHFKINADGYRAPVFTPKPPGAFRVIVVGGSTVFGTDVADRNTLPGRLYA